MTMWVRSLALLSGLRIRIAVSCGVGCSWNSNSTPSLGTCICCTCGPKKQKSKKKKKILSLFWIFSSFNCDLPSKALGEDFYILFGGHRTSWIHNLLFFIILENSQPLFLKMLLWTHFFILLSLGFQKYFRASHYFFYPLTLFEKYFPTFYIFMLSLFSFFTCSNSLNLFSCV